MATYRCAHGGLRRILRAVIASMVAAACVIPAAAGDGWACLRQMCELSGVEFDAASWSRMRGVGGGASTLEQLRIAAADIGLDVAATAEPFDGLMSRPGPKLLHVNGPGAFVVVTDADGETVQCVAEGRAYVRARSDVAALYAGEALVVAALSGDQPRLILDHFSYSFELGGVGERAIHTFTITNAGGRELQLQLRGGSCCGAPEATLSGTAVGPGGSAQLSVTLDVPSFDDVCGQVAVLSNDPCRPVTYVTLCGTPPVGVSLQPDRLYIRGVSGERPTRRVSLIAPMHVEIATVVSHNGLLSAHCERRQGGAEGMWDIDVSPLNCDDVCDATDRLVIRTNHPDIGEVTVPVRIVISASVFARPTSVFFGIVRVGHHVERTIALKSRTAGSIFRVLSAESQHVAVSAKAVQAADGQWSVVVALSPTEAGYVETTVEVNTDRAGQGSIAVPVSAYVTK